ncbi:hypothetical protein [Sphingobium sp. Sx8-8]|uniref:hypothetical protein n=1 Tax=Sphingobium sp. Sx8-8 TaxID=2933617 RepID=UPI001F56EF1B|nr:hypothetical protein [Sphingobium sp. Sx8-8]
MFRGYAGLSLDGDHLDLSYRDRDAWPDMTPKGSVKSFAFDIGDPEAGPTVLLGLMTKVEGEDLDWKHSVDPVHHHGTDQFRMVAGGEWTVAGKSMPAGTYGFQEAGWVYQEHPVHGGPVWTLLIMGDRRGSRSILRFKKDMATVIDGGEVGEAFGQPVEGEPYPHPAGDKGIAAVATTLGPCERGYLSGQVGDLGRNGKPETMTGILGDATVGPAVHVLNTKANQTIIPACVYPTELVLLVVGGACRVGDVEYSAGDMRVQRADVALDTVVAGPDGAEVLVVVGDRRAQPKLASAVAAPAWMGDVQRVLSALDPVPGGIKGHRLRAGLANA